MVYRMGIVFLLLANCPYKRAQGSTGDNKGEHQDHERKYKHVEKRDAFFCKRAKPWGASG